MTAMRRLCPSLDGFCSWSSRSNSESAKGESLMELDKCWIVDFGSFVECAVYGVVFVDSPFLHGAG